MSPEFDFDPDSDSDSGYCPVLSAAGFPMVRIPLPHLLAGHGAEKCAEQRQYVHAGRELFYFPFQVLFVCHLIFSVRLGLAG